MIFDPFSVVLLHRELLGNLGVPILIPLESSQKRPLALASGLFVAYCGLD